MTGARDHTLPPVFAGRRRSRFLLLVANGLLQALATVATALLVQSIFDSLLTESSAMRLTPLVLLGLAVLAGAALRWRAHIDAEHLGQSYAHAVRMKLFRHVARIGREGAKRFSRGALMLRFIGDLTALQRWVSLGLAQLTVSTLAGGLALSILAFVEPVIALSIAVALAATIPLTLLLGPRLTGATREARKRRGRLAARLGDRLGALGVVEAFGQERRETKVFRRLSRRLRGALIERAGLIGLLRASAEAVAGLAGLAALMVGALLVKDGLATPGAVAAAMTLAGLLAPRIQELGRVYEYWNAAKVARRKQEQLLASQPDASPIKRNKGRAVAAAAAGHIVELRRARRKGALRAIDLELAPGERLCVIGPNGAGKTSLLLLIGGFLRPDGGRVLLDGENLRRLSWRELRQVFALVSPDLPLLRGSLWHNLTYGAADTCGEEDVRRALSLCGLEDLAARLPAGLESRLADAGEGLSSGERARIALARALLAKPEILLLDEADAHLDPLARESFEKVLSGFPGSIVFITHDRRQALLADRLLHLQEGKVVALGAPGDLLREGGPSATLFKAPIKLVGA